MLLFLLSAVLSVGLPQDVTDSVAVVSGSVYELVRIGSKRTEIPVADAIVSISDERDSVVCITDAFGHFIAEDRRPGTVHIKVSKMGYEEYSGSFECNNGINLILVRLKVNSVKLSSAVVVADAVPVTHIGDTVVFHPGSVKTMEDESILEVLAQMPGVSVQNGIISVNGQKVKRTYVNGRLIFGDNAMAPLQSLLANEVTSVKSYEELSVESRRAGLMVGNKDRVLDIETKEEIFSAFDGHAILTAGADENRSAEGNRQVRYGSGLVANFYSEKFITYLTIDANNLDKESFRHDEYLRSNGPISRYRETAGGSTGLEKYWGDRLLGSNLKLSYSYRHNYDSQDRRSASDYFTPEGSVFRMDTDTLALKSTLGTHTVSLSSEIHNNTLRNLSLYAIVSASDNSSHSENGRRNFLSDVDILSQHLINDGNKRDFLVSSSAEWTGGYGSGLVPSAFARFDFGRVNETQIEADTLLSSAIYRNIRAVTGSRKANASAGVGLSKLLSNTDRESSEIKFVLGYTYSRAANDRLSTNIFPNGSTGVNQTNSFDYIWTDNSIKPEIYYSLHRPVWMLNVSAEPEFVFKSDKESFPADYQTGKWFFVPKIKVGSKIHNTEITAAIEHRAPLIQQFRDWTDDSNPLYLLCGNPELTTEKTNSLRVSHVFPDAGKYASLILYGTIDLTIDPIVSNLTFFPLGGTLPSGDPVAAGAILASYSNARHSLSADAHARWQKRIQRIKTTVVIEPGMTVSHVPTYVGDNLVPLLTLEPGASFSFTARPSKQLIFGAYERLGHIYSRADNGLEVTSMLKQNLRTYIRWNYAKAGFVNIDYQWLGFFYHGNTGVNTDIHSLNAVAGIRLLKGRMGISVSCNDILNAGSYYTQTESSVSRQQIWRPSYGRYYLLNISYKIRSRDKDVRYRGLMQEGGDEPAPFLRQ